MTIDTNAHIRSMQATAMALEEHARRLGYYASDCDIALDALVARGKKRGIALLFDEDGGMEVVDLNGGAEDVEVSREGQHVTVQHNFEGWHNPGPSKKENEYTRAKAMAAQSHEPGNRTEGKFLPQVHEAARTLAKKPTGDAARLARENAAKEKAYRADAIARNERIFAAMKERSAQIHK